MNFNFKIIINDQVTDDEIYRLRNSVGWDNNCYPFSLTKDNSFVYFAARIKKELIGFIDVVSDGYNDAYIRDLIVAKDYQNLGLGTKLMEEALQFLKQKQIKCIQVTFDSELIGFYKRFGFHIFSAGIIDKDDPTLIERKLS